MSGDINVVKKEAEKILKYKDLTIEVQRTWNVKIIGATSAISKSFRKYLSNYRKSMKSRTYRKQPYWALHHILRKKC